MKAICVRADRRLEMREVPTPSNPPTDHLRVEIEAAAITHGDKFFLKSLGTAGASAYDIWGSSAVGVVRAVGINLPSQLVGRRVAIYRSLGRSEHTVGLWSEQAIVQRMSCVQLPRTISAKDYAGSLVNIMTAYAFLAEAQEEGHKGVIVTAGSSATGLAMAAIARRRGVPAIFLTRSEDSASALRSAGIEHVLVTRQQAFEDGLCKLADELGTTAVFDGVGGGLISRIAPLLPVNSTIYLYGLLGAMEPISISSLVIMAKNLGLRRFSNFASMTVSDKDRLAAAITFLEGIIEDELFRTRVGREFAFDQIDKAMSYEGTLAAKAILIPAYVS